MLTDTLIRKTKTPAKPTKLADERGLYLLLTPSGGRWWRFKYRYAGKEKLLSLGTYPSKRVPSFPNTESQLALCGTNCNGKTFSHQMPSDPRKSSFAPKRSSTRCIVAHGVRQLARAGLGASRSRNLGRGMYELQRCVAGIEPTAGATASRRHAVVPDDRRQVAGASGTGRTHSYSAPTCSQLAARACFAGEQEHSPLLRQCDRSRCYRGGNRRRLASRRGLLNIAAIRR